MNSREMIVCVAYGNNVIRVQQQMISCMKETHVSMSLNDRLVFFTLYRT